MTRIVQTRTVTTTVYEGSAEQADPFGRLIGLVVMGFILAPAIAIVAAVAVTAVATLITLTAALAAAAMAVGVFTVLCDLGGWLVVAVGSRSWPPVAWPLTRSYHRVVDRIINRIRRN